MHDKKGDSYTDKLFTCVRITLFRPLKYNHALPFPLFTPKRLSYKTLPQSSTEFDSTSDSSPRWPLLDSRAMIALPLETSTGRATLQQLLSLRSQDDSPQPSQPPVPIVFLTPLLPLPFSVIYTARPFPTTLTPSNSSSTSAMTPRPATAGFSFNAHSTPTPGVTLSRDLSESHADALPAVVAQSAPTPPLPRKKSGGPLKPSLKLKNTGSRGSLTVNTSGVNSSSSKSAPTTPTHKGVRFHPELEHVKYFLAEQKPLAVSRDGSPTDTSETDSEFPLFIYPRDDDLKERPLVMHRIDVPMASSLAEDTCDIVVENIDLVGSTVEGIIRVRNLAFDKSIAVYFTLDHWETTSEVTARYKASLPNGTFDWFRFSIKLGDVLSHAQEKTLYLAVRYAVSGREIWDNNNGRNYQVRIVHKKTVKINKGAMVESCEESFQDDINHIMDLRRQLEQIVEHGYPSETIRNIISHESRRRWDSLSPAPSPPLRDGTSSSTVEGFFAARCDIAASSRCPPATTRQIPFRARANTHPSARPDKVSSFFPDRDPDSGRESDDGSTTAPSRRRKRSGARNHTRGGFIEPSDVPGVKCTPPAWLFGSPVLRTFAAA